MNWAIIVGIACGLLLIGLTFLLKEGILVLIFWLVLLIIFAFVMYLIYKWIFPPNWKDL